MGLRIATNIASQTVQKNLSKVSNESTSSLEKLSSGKRINKSADDAAGLAISTKLEASTRGLRQATRNANDGISLVQTAEGGLNEVQNILVRQRELGVQAASDTVGEKERGYLDKEFQQLGQELDRIAQSTTFNGKPLIRGEGDEMQFQVGNNEGENNVISFDSGATDATAGSLGVDGLSVADRDDARSSLSDIDDALDNVSGQRATLGAIQSRLQSTVSNLEVQTINEDAAKSVIQDTDVASETAKMASANVVKSAGISTLSQANNIPNSAIRLIG